MKPNNEGNLHKPRRSVDCKRNGDLKGKASNVDENGIPAYPEVARRGPSGPRRMGEGTEEEEQGVLSVEKLPGGLQVPTFALLSRCYARNIGKYNRA
eukprot:3605122-Pyramimonas_sp.AAC.1